MVRASDKRKESKMKTMTGRELGEPCDFGHTGKDADEVINVLDSHLRERVAECDDTHADVLNDMKSRWRRPISGMGWYKQVRRDFVALPTS